MGGGLPAKPPHRWPPRSCAHKGSVTLAPRSRPQSQCLGRPLLFPLFHFNELLARGDLCFSLPNKEMNTSPKNTGKRKRQSGLWSRRCWMCHWQGPKAAGPSRGNGAAPAASPTPAGAKHSKTCAEWVPKVSSGVSISKQGTRARPGELAPRKERDRPGSTAQSQGSRFRPPHPPLCPGMQGVPTPLPCSQGCPSSLARPCPTSGGDEGKCEVGTALSACFSLDLPCSAPASLQFGEEAGQLLGPGTGGSDHTAH